MSILTLCALRVVVLCQTVCMLKVTFLVFAVLKSRQSLGFPLTSMGHWFFQVTFVTDSEIDLDVLGCVRVRVCVLAVIET